MSSSRHFACCEHQHGNAGQLKENRRTRILSKAEKHALERRPWLEHRKIWWLEKLGSKALEPLNGKHRISARQVCSQRGSRVAHNALSNSKDRSNFTQQLTLPHCKSLAQNKSCVNNRRARTAGHCKGLNPAAAALAFSPSVTNRT